jgi:hypothetical protein
VALWVHANHSLQISSLKIRGRPEADWLAKAQEDWARREAEAMLKGAGLISE